MAKKKGWSEKLATCKPHVVKHLDKNLAGMKAGQQMLVPSPKLLDEFIQKIPEGDSMNVLSMRETLAEQHQADVTCPIATGFAIKIVAEAAFERLDQGDSLSQITPVWRVLDRESPTMQKVSFDPKAFLNQRLVERIG